MTPHSTDRAHSISPLDIFGATAPQPSGSDAGPARAFEAVLNKVTSPPKTAWHRQPVQQPSADQSQPRTDFQRTSASAGKKQPAKARQASGPQRKDDDPESSDESAANQTASAPTSGPSPTDPQTQDPQDNQDAAAEGAPPVDSASEQILGNNADTAQPLAAIAAQQGTPQPNAASDSSEPETSAAAVPTSENPPATDKPALNPAKPEASGKAALSPTESAAAAAGNGSLPPGELGTDPAGGSDPLVAIDGQTAAAAAEIQPAESSSNSKDKGSDESTGNDAPQQNAGDTPQLATPSLDPLANPQAQSTVAIPPPTVSDAPASTKDAPQPPTSPATAAAGVQPAASRLPQHVLTRTEVHRGYNPAPVPVDSARFLSRVAKAFLSAQQRDGNEVRLRLSPPELGSLKLQVSVQDGVMVARMETETEAARSSLVNNLPGLRERLEEQGIRVERFDIDLMQRPSTGTPDRPSDPQQQHEPQPLRSLRAQPAASDAPLPVTVSNHWNGQGGLNVII